MCDAVLEHVAGADALIMAAAVADYRPLSASEQKIKKTDGDLNIALAPTTDILASARGGFVRVGFAAESENLVPNAKLKVRSKGLDLIAANDITAEDSGFGVGHQPRHPDRPRPQRRRVAAAHQVRSGQPHPRPGAKAVPGLRFPMAGAKCEAAGYYCRWRLQLRPAGCA